MRTTITVEEVNVGYALFEDGARIDWPTLTTRDAAEYDAACLMRESGSERMVDVVDYMASVGSY